MSVFWIGLIMTKYHEKTENMSYYFIMRSRLYFLQMVSVTMGNLSGLILLPMCSVPIGRLNLC